MKLKTKTGLLFFVLLCTIGVGAQQKYSTKSGTILFEASVPSFEEVKAVNNSASAILNVDKGEFAALALITGFRFKVALMEEHFNENYMESSQYPKALFKGKLENFSLSEVGESPTSFKLKGQITLHGVTRPLETLVKLRRDGDHIQLEASFVLLPEDFDIEIPSIVSNKIAKEVNVTVQLNLAP